VKKNKSIQKYFGASLCVPSWLNILPLGNTKGFTKGYNVLLPLLFLFISSLTIAQKPKPNKPIPPISFGKDGKLAYSPDSLGNRIPDFSYCGYMAGEQSIPDVPIKIKVRAQQGDMTRKIQDALDYIAKLPIDKNGFRGAVLLEKGLYEIQGGLKIKASGIVLRGSGMAESGTILYGAGLDRQTLITIKGVNNRKTDLEQPIIDAYVPVNALKIKVATDNNFKPGDKVIIHRPSTKEWIQTLGTDHFGGGITSLGWKPEDRDIYWDRIIVSVAGESITLDAPLTTALDQSYGVSTIAKYNWTGRIEQIGIENLRCISAFDNNNPKDEEHRWMAITMENVCNAWIRRVIFEHFAGSAVALWETTRQITVEDCKSLSPVSEIGGQRRNTFWATGQQALFQRIYSENGYHDFAAGYCSSLNAFVQCESHLSYSFSGAIDSWASGILFDVVNLDGNALSYKNLGQDLQGAGWNAANSVFWNCSAARVDCYQPPTANNWAFGTWAQFSGNGYWGDSNNSIQPRSLYYSQLIDRLGETAKNRAILLPVETEASSSPSVEQAAILTRDAVKPHLQLTELIDQASQRQPLSTDTKDTNTIQTLSTAVVSKRIPTKIENGWLTNGKIILTGGNIASPWWNGNIKPKGLKNAIPAITRFVPGRTGLGLTDDLEELTDTMKTRHITSFEQNYALWYERRRDDHERIRRMDGDVWTPFYELPFARTGQGSAWDGLSLYDLTKYNHWYWFRLKQFADLADSKGLVLINHHYFQHNIIEAGAHWVDCPWRSANNINHTGFPEPVPFAGDKRIFMAEQFYDTTNTARKDLHKAFIRQNLNNFKENPGVIQLISAEFTGPYHFVKFWLETIKDWEKETGKRQIIGLSVTKDVQDSVLANPDLASIVDLIDIRYWSYREDGSTYAPQGWQNLAPRQHARLVKPGKRSFEQTYRAVREYRENYPGKAVIYSADSWDKFGWAVFMAGGSIANIPVISDPRFLEAAASAIPADAKSITNNLWSLEKKGYNYIFYCNAPCSIPIDLINYPYSFHIRRINPVNGLLSKSIEKTKGGKRLEIKNNSSEPIIVWVSRD
jgi:hypothetical protein